MLHSLRTTVQSIDARADLRDLMQRFYVVDMKMYPMEYDWPTMATPRPSRSEASSVMKFYFCILLGSHFCLSEIVFRSFVKDSPNVNMNVSSSALIYLPFVNQTSRLGKKTLSMNTPPRFAGMRALGWSFGDRRHGHPSTSNSKSIFFVNAFRSNNSIPRLRRSNGNEISCEWTVRKANTVCKIKQ